MSQALLDGSPLKVHPKKVAQLRAIGFGLIAVFGLPWGVGLVRMSLGRVWGPGGDMWPVALLSAGGIFFGLLFLRRLRRLRHLGRQYVEVHAPITKRSELVENNEPTGKLVFHYRLDRQGAAGLEGSVKIAIADGGPLHADGLGNRLVVLASQTKPRLFQALRIDGYPFALTDEQARHLRRRMIEQGVALRFGRGLPNRASVARGLRVLLGAEARGDLPPRPAAGRVTLPGLDRSDPLISVQKLTRTVVQAYGFDPGTVLVTPRDKLEAAGQVEYEPGRGFFVEIRTEMLAKPQDLEVTLAHEVAHIFLATHGLVDPDRFEHEVQTDLAAALWGFGQAMIAIHKNELKRLGGWEQTTGWERTIHGLGYITAEECAWAMAKVTDRRALKRNAAPHARPAIRVGARRAGREARLGVLAGAPLPHRLIYKLRRLLAGPGFLRGLASSKRLKFEPGKVAFACPRCTQAMRLPVKKSGTATCPACRMELPFSS